MLAWTNSLPVPKARNGKLENLTEGITTAEFEAQKAAGELKAVVVDRQNVETAVQKAEVTLKLAYNQKEDLESKQIKKQAERSARLSDQARFKAQLDVLEQAERSLTGYAEGAKTLLDASRQNQTWRSSWSLFGFSGCTRGTRSGDICRVG